MNTEDFYALTPGAIGHVWYTARTREASEERVESIMSGISSQNFSAYLANYALTGGSKMDPQTAFERFRAKAREEAEQLATEVVRFQLHLQIGQRESLDLIIRTEASGSFVAWEDEGLVSCIKNTPLSDI